MTQNVDTRAKCLPVCDNKNLWELLIANFQFRNVLTILFPFVRDPLHSLSIWVLCFTFSSPFSHTRSIYKDLRSIGIFMYSSAYDKLGRIYSYTTLRGRLEMNIVTKNSHI